MINNIRMIKLKSNFETHRVIYNNYVIKSKIKKTKAHPFKILVSRVLIENWLLISLGKSCNKTRVNFTQLRITILNPFHQAPCLTQKMNLYVKISTMLPLH